MKLRFTVWVVALDWSASDSTVHCRVFRPEEVSNNGARVLVVGTTVSRAFGSQIVDKWEMPVIVREAVLHYQHYQQAKVQYGSGYDCFWDPTGHCGMLWPETVSFELVMHSEVFATESQLR